MVAVLRIRSVISAKGVSVRARSTWVAVEGTIPISRIYVAATVSGFAGRAVVSKTCGDQQERERGEDRGQTVHGPNGIPSLY